MYSYSLPVSFDDLIRPYKTAAKQMAAYDPKLTLTEAQHEIASRCFDFKDWQSFSYWLSEIFEASKTVNLTENEWNYICEVYNGLILDSYQITKESLILGIYDVDFYMDLSSKWLDAEPRLAKDDYIVSDSLKKFVQKIEGFSEQQCKGIILRALSFWDAEDGVLAIWGF